MTTGPTPPRPPLATGPAQPGQPQWGPVQPGQPQWGPPPWAHVRPTNTKAILAVALLWVPVAPVVLAVMARREIARTGEGGQGLATVGLAVGIAYLTLYVLYFLFIVLYFAAFAFFLVPFASSTGWMS